MTHLLLFVALLLPQAPASPYTVEFDNNWARVTRAIYPAHTEIPSHSHNDLAAAFVYLNDAPPVIFKHDEQWGAVTRPATKTGAVRLYRAVTGEHHGVENPGDVASIFLRVEFKTTEAANPRTLIGRFPSLDAPAADNLVRTQFENDQVRMTRIFVAPGRTEDIRAAAGQPALVIEIPSGKARWVEANSSLSLGNTAAKPAEFLRFDLKTPPAK